MEMFLEEIYPPFRIRESILQASHGYLIKNYLHTSHEHFLEVLHMRYFVMDSFENNVYLWVSTPQQILKQKRDIVSK